MERAAWLVNVRSRRREQRGTERGCGRRWSPIVLFVYLFNSAFKICEIFTALYNRMKNTHSFLLKTSKK